MGAWGHGPFDNDVAGDWLGELLKAGADAITKAFEAVLELDDDDYLDVEQASAALAAAELVSRADAGKSGSLPEDAAQWLQQNCTAVEAVDRTLARQAVERVFDRSELRELWDENGPNTAWHLETRNLLQRLA